MEKVFLKPTSKEILFKTGEPDTFSDSFEYGPRDEKDRHLGRLYVVGNVKYEKENMAYVLNLISSLAKREYYSENGSIQEDPKKAFELTLKKLNDVLEDFFKNKDLKIHLGLMAIAGENIYVSKLGKFKVFLARASEAIDIFNNVDLFQQEQTEEKQFSNIVSGKVRKDDKLFAVFPTRQIVARTKVINTILVDKGQEEFVAELASLHESRKNFPCCGFHIEISKVKEQKIPIRSVYKKYNAKVASATSDDVPDAEVKTEETQSEATSQLDTSDHKENELEPEDPVEEKEGIGVLGAASSSEISVINRRNVFGKIHQKLFPSRPGGKINGKKSWVTGLVLVLILGGGMFAFRGFIFGQSQQESVLNNVNENVKLAETKITQNDNTAARELLALSLSSITGIAEASKKIEDIKTKINALLDKMDLVSSRQPESFFVSASHVISKITPTEEDNVLIAVNQDGQVLKIDSAGASPISSVAELKPTYTFSTGENFVIFNGLDGIGSLNIKSGKYSSYTLNETEPIKDAAMYANNLYVLSENAIYKYSDAVAGGKRKQLWLGGLTDSGKLSIAIDGNIYVLYADGTIVKYFKGKEERRVNLNFTFDPQVRLLVDGNPDSPYFYVADYSEKRIRAFDKTTGSLILTYKATQLPLLKDIVLAKDTLYLLTIDSQIWRISLQ